MKIDVTVIHCAFDDAERPVAVVSASDKTLTACLEEAFVLTNNIDNSWVASANPAVRPVPEVVAAGGARSTSVGDVMSAGGKRYRVASIGFSLEPGGSQPDEAANPRASNRGMSR